MRRTTAPPATAAAAAPTARDSIAPTRRRFIALFAFAAMAATRRLRAGEPDVVRWQGQAFGAETSITIGTDDVRHAHGALADAVAEIDRLERALSLYRRDSALVRLNTAGHLDDPPQALRAVLQAAAEVSRISGGAFDVTVQPLWEAHLRAAADPHGSDAAIEEARTHVGWQDVRIERQRISFARPRMAVTLNGIAQGYAADHIAEMLRTRGFDHVLADLGEFRAIGMRATGMPWRVGVAQPVGGRGPSALATVLDLADRGLATSSPLGTPLDRAGIRHHLFDPHTGRCVATWASASVVAPTAMVADALSTAIAVAPPDAAQHILAAGGGIEAIVIDFGGGIRRLRA